MQIKKEDISDLMKQIFGNEVVLCEKIETNNNMVFFIKVRGEEYIVKFYSYKNWPEIDKIPYISQLLQENNIPCAAIKAYERADSKYDNGYIIEEKISGISILSKDGIPMIAEDKFKGEFETRIYSELAEMVSKVHRITFPKYGYINCGYPNYNTFSEFMEEMILQCNTDGLIENHVFTKPAITKLVHEICERFKQYDDLRPVLCHGDLSMRNVIYNDGTLTLIDWDDSMALPWMADVAYLTYPFMCSKTKNVENRKVFLDSYVTDSDKNRFDKFETLYHTILSIKYLDWLYKYNQGKGTEGMMRNMKELLKNI